MQLAAAFKRIEPEPQTKPCDVCGEEFTAYFDLQKICDSCVHDSRKLLDAATVREQRATEQQRAYERLGLNGRLAQMGLETFDYRLQAEGFEAVNRVVEQWPKLDPLNIALLGDRGIGKTHLAVGLLLYLASQRVYGRFHYWPGTVTNIKMAEEQRTAERALLEPLKTVPMLVMDDVGAEKTTEHLDNWRDVIIDARWVAGLPTVFTGNITPVEFREWLGEAGASRVLSSCSLVAMAAISDQRRRPQVMRPTPGGESVPCPGCAGAGWLVDREGRVGRIGGLMKCPQCNGAGYQCQV